MKVPTPRDYQEKGINLIRQAIIDGHRCVMLWLATGGGKSVVFLNLVYSMLKKGNPTLLLVKRKQLVFQTKKHFDKAGIDSSVLIANHKGFDPSKDLQIASIDTITRREIEFLKRFKCVIIDECHDATAKNYRTLLDKLKDEFKIPFFIGLTATPFPIGKKVHDFFQAVVKPIEVHELRDRKFLVPVDLYRPSCQYDFSELKVDSMTGDFKTKMTSDFMKELKIIGDIVEEYKSRGEGKAAICFCVDKNHSMVMSDAFNDAGIKSVHCDESTPQKERDESIAMLQEYARKGIPFVLCNVNIFSTGVDIPEAEVGIMARPTMSEVLYIQQVGRLLRPYRRCGKCKQGYDNSDKCYHCGWDKPEYVKHKAVILDHGDNTSRFGEPFQIRFAVLNQDQKKKRDEDDKIVLVKTCSKCFMTRSAFVPKCENPDCQSEETKERFYNTQRGELRPYDEFEVMKNFHEQMKLNQRIHNFKPAWTQFKMYEKFGDVVMKYKKEFGIENYVPKLVKKQLEEKKSGRIYR